MQLLTQNSDLKKGGIFGWTLPAHWITREDGSKFNTCPNAGICAAFCYAKSGRWNFSNVRKAHLEKLELALSDNFVPVMNEELSKKKYAGKFIRIHDGGDFFNVAYLMKWRMIAVSNPQCTFYSYTKEVSMVKKFMHTFPDNLIIIFSFGGREDALINRNRDRNSDVFTSLERLVEEGYSLIGDDDSFAATSENKKVGLLANNIKHLVKKQGDKSFSDWSLKKRA
jgi:hypothetical protein